MWVYVGDATNPYNVFDFTVNRKRDGPQSFLADFHGYLHADAFSGYDALYLPSPRADRAPILEVACNAHARRKNPLPHAGEGRVRDGSERGELR